MVAMETVHRMWLGVYFMCKIEIGQNYCSQLIIVILENAWFHILKYNFQLKYNYSNKINVHMCMHFLGGATTII